MKRTQCLHATYKVTRSTVSGQTSMNGRGSLAGANQWQQIAKHLEGLSATERRELENLIGPQLARERRRCNARALNYDVNRHIQLYVTEKLLLRQS